ncbi:Piso0_000407 [Millerozyma farinosa CBS 7064]|uniref:Clathrin light chain n=1 Tax=Pichia sorbitophila (strain ATCC MYA-4447 / BCRC 22081 / CBS 7064 / NBRC 10061 / NRRL Y-12695) TaxID=559304 RepID=G8YVD0_PICSO|nr:Piso0_000407 [Millerozyma farinosa CBS 7064]CCE73374.1 Piso0_000407 [Millerozyma farinosa CBS 7064]
MADKFPALGSIDKDLPVVEGSENYGGSDFLSREKELVGDEFKTEDDKKAFEESDDEFNDFKEQYPEVDYQNNVGSEESSAGQFAESTEQIYTQFEDGEEPRSIKDWRERRELEISERDKANAKKKESIIEEARQTVDDFYDNYNSKKEQNSKKVLEEQQAFLEKRDNFLKRGTFWDRADELINEAGELPIDEKRDRSRLEGLLAKLKGKDNVPAAGGY